MRGVKLKTGGGQTRVVRPRRASGNVLEWRLQAAAVRRVNQLLATFPKTKPPFAFAGDMNGVFIPGAQAKVKAKATGLTAGEPDLRFYFPGGVLKSIEIKNKDGRLTASQKERHPILEGLGFEVVVVKCKTEDEAADEVERLVVGWLAANDNQPHSMKTDSAA